MLYFANDQQVYVLGPEYSKALALVNALDTDQQTTLRVRRTIMLKSHAQVETPKAVRYMKALCNHFSRRIPVEYSEQQGKMQFGDGVCTLDATGKILDLNIQADSAEQLERLKKVVADHLQRFSEGEGLQVAWVDQAA